MADAKIGTDGLVDCPMCDGWGVHTERDTSRYADLIHKDCGWCDGTGRVTVAERKRCGNEVRV